MVGIGMALPLEQTHHGAFARLGPDPATRAGLGEGVLEQHARSPFSCTTPPDPATSNKVRAKASHAFVHQARFPGPPGKLDLQMRGERNAYRHAVALRGFRFVKLRCRRR